jgi:branched-subunit amino acid transport protein AzlD
MEILGRLLMIIVLMSAASLAGIVCALLIYFIFRLRRRSSFRAYLAAVLYPPAVMAYLLACLIFSSILSGFLGTPDLFFGDIRENLPNGYTLEALDKMPECGHIQRAGNSLFQVAWVEGVQIAGPYVLGEYNYTYFPKTADDVGRNYFLLDTRTGKLSNFATESALGAAVSVNVHLTPTPNFHGLRTFQSRVATLLLFLLAVIPPLAAGIWLMRNLLDFLKPERSAESG